MGSIKLKELNDIIKDTLYVGSGNQRRENEHFWSDLGLMKFDGYDTPLMANLHKIVGDASDIERLAQLIEWEGENSEAELDDMLDYIADHIRLRRKEAEIKELEGELYELEEGEGC